MSYKESLSEDKAEKVENIVSGMLLANIKLIPFNGEYVFSGILNCLDLGEGRRGGGLYKAKKILGSLPRGAQIIVTEIQGEKLEVKLFSGTSDVVSVIVRMDDVLWGTTDYYDGDIGDAVDAVWHITRLCDHLAGVVEASDNDDHIQREMGKHNDTLDDD